MSRWRFLAPWQTLFDTDTWEKGKDRRGAPGHRNLAESDSAGPHSHLFTDIFNSLQNCDGARQVKLMSEGFFWLNRKEGDKELSGLWDLTGPAKGKEAKSISSVLRRARDACPVSYLDCVCWLGMQNKNGMRTYWFILFSTFLEDVLNANIGLVARTQTWVRCCPGSCKDL